MISFLKVTIHFWKIYWYFFEKTQNPFFGLKSCRLKFRISWIKWKEKWEKRVEIFFLWKFSNLKKHGFWRLSHKQYLNFFQSCQIQIYSSRLFSWLKRRSETLFKVSKTAFILKKSVINYQWKKEGWCDKSRSLTSWFMYCILFLSLEGPPVLFIKMKKW